MAKEELLKEYDEKSGPRGFFLPLYKEVCQDLTSDQEGRVGEIHGDTTELLKFTHSLECVSKRIRIEEAWPRKSSEEAKKMKDAGNKAYQEGSRTGQEGKDLEALTCYTQAIIQCPVDREGKSREFSICLANRSAVLFSLKWYKQSEQDIKLALASGYPEELAYKLYQRRAKIQTVFKDLDGACASYRQALKATELASKLSTGDKRKVQGEMVKTLNFLNNTPDNIRKKLAMEQKVEARSLPKVSEANPLYPAMSSAVAIRWQKGRGRYAVATRDIQVGETLVVERPIVSHPLPQALAQNCAACFSTLQTPLACYTCTRALYCGAECRERHLPQHRFACKLTDFFDSAGLSVLCHLAYSLVTAHPPSWFVENSHMWEQQDEKNGESTQRTEEYLSSDYRNVFNLVSHHQRMTQVENFHRAVFAVFLLRCLQSQGYFSKETDTVEELDGEMLVVARLLFHFLELLQFNTHEVAQLEMRGRRFEEGAKSELIGAAVYPTLAMFNHSCEASVNRFFTEDTITVQSIKTIRKGEEIFENYGPLFFISRKEDRQERLKKQYWFDCRCQACEEDWPLLQEMEQKELNFRCSVCNDSVPCNMNTNNPSLKCSCGNIINLLINLKTLGDLGENAELANQHLEKQELAPAHRIFNTYLGSLDTLLAPPYQDYYKVQQNIWKLSWMQWGNKMVTKGRMAVPKKDLVDLD